MPGKSASANASRQRVAGKLIGFEKSTLRLKLALRVGLLALAALLAASAQAQTVMVWGDDTWGQVTGVDEGHYKVVDGGSINGVGLRVDGTPVLWGIGDIGPPALTPELENERFRAVGLGRDGAVFIRPDGSLVAFGEPLSLHDVPPGLYRDVTVAASHAVAIAKDGTLAAWGQDILGTLNTPAGGPFTAVSSRVLYTLALREDGTLFGWGVSPPGTNLFAGWAEVSETPGLYHLPGEQFRAIAAGNVHALAIESDGSVKGWGNGTGGALRPPTHVQFKAVTAGAGFSAGLSVDGTLWAWGTPLTNSDYAPVPWGFDTQPGWARYGDTDLYFVPEQRFKSIAAGAFHLMAITQGP